MLPAVFSDDKGGIGCHPEKEAAAGWFMPRRGEGLRR